MVTEEKARQKKCPMTFNNGQRLNCVASDCMVWNWDRFHNDEVLKEARRSFAENADHEPPHIPPFTGSPEHTEALARRLGWCGLAHKDDE